LSPTIPLPDLILPLFARPPELVICHRVLRKWLEAKVGQRRLPVNTEDIGKKRRHR
jgi:hypothetical protein